MTPDLFAAFASASLLIQFYTLTQKQTDLQLCHRMCLVYLFLFAQTLMLILNKQQERSRDIGRSSGVKFYDNAASVNEPVYLPARQCGLMECFHWIYKNRKISFSSLTEAIVLLIN